MRVCVFGLGHLGSVTAACLAELGHETLAFDFDAATVGALARGVPPVYEPGLSELVAAGLRSGLLQVTTDSETARSCDLVWVADDIPIDEKDRPDAGYVVERVMRLAPSLAQGTLVLVSSQVPVGTVARLERELPALRLAYSPENLRLGTAIDAFMRPARVVVGIRSEADRALLEPLFSRVGGQVEWMSVESAEMTKHALNALLATSIAFANEIATLCEATGADAGEVERGLRSEPRIGHGLPLRAGLAFGGGTLARDLAALEDVGGRAGLRLRLLEGVRESNEAHKEWALSTLERAEALGGPVAVWGLAYKPGTDSVRRSVAVELCSQLIERGTGVRTHDPAVRELPDALRPAARLCSTAAEAVEGSGALVVATEWPEYRDVEPEVIVQAMSRPLVVDAGGFLARTFGGDPRIRYFSVGRRP